jgi:hypothetical protein
MFARLKKPAFRRIATAAVFALGVGAAGIASASAYGYSWWGVHVFKDIPIPGGHLFRVVEGAGLQVRDVGVNFLSAGNLCNWKIDVDFLDSAGHRYDGVSSGTVRSCTHAAQRHFILNRNMKEGRACIRLYTAFTDPVASVCHNIVR